MKRPLPLPLRRPVGQFLKKGRPTVANAGHQLPRSPAMALLKRELARMSSMGGNR